MVDLHTESCFKALYGIFAVIFYGTYNFLVWWIHFKFKDSLEMLSTEPMVNN